MSRSTIIMIPRAPPFRSITKTDSEERGKETFREEEVERGMRDWNKIKDRGKRKKKGRGDKWRGGVDRLIGTAREKKPHWFSVGMCRLRRTKRLQHLICDILLWKLSLSLSLPVWRSSLATAVHKVWSMAELCHRIVNLADSAACPMTNNKHAWPPITMRDVRTEQPIKKQT